MNLKNIIYLRNRIELISADSFLLKGNILILVKEDIEVLKELINLNVVELYSEKGVQIYENTLNSIEGNKLVIDLNIGKINNYYEKLQDFLNGNKFKCKYTEYYIAEIDYTLGDEKKDIIRQYDCNLQLIDFLKKIADNEKYFGNSLELFFYKAGKGVDIKIDYSIQDIEKITFSISEKLVNDILEAINGTDKKQLFINELISYLEKNGNSYQKLIEGWENLISNYDKSYSLFLAGFSFDKIKTSSTEHFQKLADRFYESIAKASNYIFGIPIGYILLLNNFDFEGENLLKNLMLIILGLIFFIMIWFVLFKNIEESIDVIEAEIDKYIDNIKNRIELEQISNDLSSFKKTDIKKQKDKLALVKFLTFLVYLIIIFTFIFIFLDKTIFYI